MTDASIYRSTLQRHLVSESDTDSLNSIVNPQGNPGQFVPPDRVQSNPNVSLMNPPIQAQGQ